MKKLFLWLFLCGITMLFGQGNIHFTTTNAGKVNLYKYDPVEADGWPGITIANLSIKFDDAGGGGFYSDNINPQKKFILNNFDGSGSQTGNISISEDTWGQYNGTSTFTSLMTTSTMTNVGIVKFASGGLPGGWATQENTSYDATNQVYTLTKSYTSGSGFDIYINGTKFLYRSTSQVTGYSTSYSNTSATITFNPYTGVVAMTPGPTVSANAISTTLCAGASVNVPYTATGTFGSGNTFTAQLSDASGSFSAPTTIGSLASNSSGTIVATIPAGVSYGTGYRIRVVASNPNIIGGNNGTDLIIFPAILSATIQSPKTATICDNAAFTVYGRVGAAGITNNDSTPFTALTAQFGYGMTANTGSWTWVSATHNLQGASVDHSKDEYNYTIPANTLTAGTYYYGFKFSIGDCTEVVGGQNGIFNNDPGVLTVSQSTTINSQPTSSQTVNLYTHTTLSVSTTANSSGPLTYQWYRNTTNSNVGGSAIPGENASSYVVNTYTSGTFYYYVVASTGSGFCDSNASNVSTVVVNNAETSGTANWANIQSPKMETDIFLGVGVDVFAQVFVPGSTPGQGQAPDIKAWIGYSTEDTSPNSWSEAQWKVAEINEFQAHLIENNDEYMIQGFGADLPAGTYYVASRFQKGTGAYIYGGTEDTTDNVSGGIWGVGPYKSLKLNVGKIVTWISNAGATAGEWNNINGPEITSPAIIATDITSPPSFSAKNLTINNGVGLTIPSGQSITLENELINNNGNATSKTVVVESGANFIQNNVSIANIGNIRVKRDASVAGDQYNFWSSPVSGQDLYSMYQTGNAVAPKRVFTYNTLTDYYTTVNSGTFVKGVGYSIRGEGTGNSNAHFFGAPNNGDVPVALLSGGQRYNLIGNPYPSNIVAEKFYLENEDKIEATLWFWDNTGNTALTQMGSGYSTNYSTNNFAQYNITSGVANSGTGVQNQASKKPNGTIVVGQGFIVRVKEGVTNPSVSFKNSMRNKENGVFFSKQNQQKNVFWLELIAPSKFTNTTAVVYNEGAQNSLDSYDSELSSLSSDAVYSSADNNSKKLSIQGRDPNQLSEDKVKLGVQFYNNGIYTYSLKDKLGIFADDQSIYLHDKQMNVFTNLQNENYTFTAVKGLDDNRFEIVYKENAVLGNNETKISDFQIYREGSDYVIQSDKHLGRIEVYNMTGQLLKTFLSNGKTFKILSSDLSFGAYIIKAHNSGDVRTKKIIR